MLHSTPTWTYTIWEKQNSYSDRQKFMKRIFIVADVQTKPFYDIYVKKTKVNE